MSKEELMKISVEEFSRLQDWMILTPKDSEVYISMKMSTSQASTKSTHKLPRYQSVKPMICFVSFTLFISPPCIDTIDSDKLLFTGGRRQCADP